MTNDQTNVYTQRINRVLDYIRAQPAGDLSLEQLAEVASFSQFHFHRLFVTFVGETVHQFVLRSRLEYGARLLHATPNRAITDIAYDAGFAAPEHFSRAFRKQFERSPSQWRREKRKIRQAARPVLAYTGGMDLQAQRDNPFPVEIRHLPATPLAYVRALNAYQPGVLVAAYERLLAWADSQAIDPLAHQLIGMSQDDPDVTPHALCRYDIALTVDVVSAAPHTISRRVLPACTVAVVRCQGDIMQVDHAWETLYRHWLPASSYEPANLPAMEFYKRHPSEIGWETFDLDCCLPITPLRLG